MPSSGLEPELGDPGAGHALGCRRELLLAFLPTGHRAGQLQLGLILTTLAQGANPLQPEFERGT